MRAVQVVEWSEQFQKHRLRLWLVLLRTKVCSSRRGKKPFDGVVYYKELSKPSLIADLLVFSGFTTAAVE